MSDCSGLPRRSPKARVGCDLTTNTAVIPGVDSLPLASLGRE